MASTTPTMTDRERERDINTACEAAIYFCNQFYPALNDLSPLTPYYLPACPLYPPNPPPPPPSPSPDTKSTATTPAEPPKPKLLFSKDAATATSFPATTTTKRPMYITINGHEGYAPADVEKIIARQANNTKRRVHHEVQSIDAIPLNRQFIFCAPAWIVENKKKAQLAKTEANPPTGPGQDGSGGTGPTADPTSINQKFDQNGHVDAMSISVTVTGMVRFGAHTDHTSPMPRAFTDNLVLVPNWEAVAVPPGASRGQPGQADHPKRMRWLIQSQVFRTV